MAPLLSRFSDNFGLVLGKIGSSGPGEQNVYTPILQNPLSGASPNYSVNPDVNASSLVLALPFVSGGRDSGFGDYSGDIRSTTNRTVSVTDSTSLDTTNSKFYGSCFDTSCKMSVNMSTYASLTGEFCWEYWVRVTAFGTFGFFLGKASVDNAKGQGTKFFNNPTNATIAFANNDSELSTTILTAGSISQSTNTWYHHAWTRDPNNIVRFFLNGVPSGSGTYSGTIAASIGFLINTVDYAYTGQLQDMRVYVGTKKYSNSGFSVP